MIAFRARMKQAVRAARASNPSTPAAPNSPAPIPACLPFWVSSALASSSSWWTSWVISCDSCLSSSGRERSRKSPGSGPGGGSCRVAITPPLSVSPSGQPLGVGWAVALDRRMAGRGWLRVVDAHHRHVAGRHRVGRRVGSVVAGPYGGVGAQRLIAPVAGRLQEPGGGKPEREPASRHQPRLAAGKVLDVAEDALAAGRLQIIAQAVGLAGCLLDQPGWGVLALPAQLLSDAAHVA